jgi:hypothetical protein
MWPMLRILINSAAYSRRDSSPQLRHPAKYTLPPGNSYTSVNNYLFFLNNKLMFHPDLGYISFQYHWDLVIKRTANALVYIFVNWAWVFYFEFTELFFA